jgi:hypothetical protein
MNTREAFFQVVKEAVPAKASYVSLYVNVPFYGGPEEGGWWGNDTELVAYHRVSNDVEAEAILTAVRAQVARLDKEAHDRFTRQCAAECEWLEARGLDSDYLPEVDGNETYWVTTESTPGSCVTTGERCYS